MTRVTTGTGWCLAIDFGTVSTVVALTRGDITTLVDVEGNGSNRLHSGVFLQPSGSLLVGEKARQMGAFTPDRYEATPKRSVGEGAILLGDRTVQVTDVLAAIFLDAAAAARRVAGGAMPDAVYLTHPADWQQTRLGVLLEAARIGRLENPVLVPEPVAAAVHIGAATTALGRHVAVYDLGGGTFDAAVLRRTATGYDIVGPPGGRDPMGGEDFDHRILNHLGSGSAGADPAWAQLMSPQDVRWRRAAADLREQVRRAKEGLSTTVAWPIWVPGVEREIQLTRAEFEGLITQDVELTVDIMLDTIGRAGITTADLEGVYLVGGSSRIPLVAETIWQRTGLQPHTYDDPKAVVALGAARQAPPTSDLRPVAAPAIAQSAPPVVAAAAQTQVQSAPPSPEPEGKSASQVAPRPTPILSPDGRFWWDGRAWVSHPGAATWQGAVARPAPQAATIPAPSLSPDGRFWWDGRAWAPYPGAATSQAAVAPPIRVTALVPTTAGVDAWFAGTDVDSVSDLIRRFFFSLGFKFTRRDGQDSYGLNMGKIGRQQWYKVTVERQAGSIHAVIFKWMGSTSKKNTAQLPGLFRAFLSNPQNLQR